MPTQTPGTTVPYNDPFAAYYSDPSAFNAPAGYGNVQTTSQGLFGGMGGGGMSLPSGIENIPIIGSLLQSIFGGKQQTNFKPYIDANGNYVWAPPSDKVPVPV